MKTKSFIQFLLILFSVFIFTFCNKPISVSNNEIETILSEKMKGFNSVNSVKVTNDGYFQVANLNEEIAPYFVGEVIRKRHDTIEQIACANLLTEINNLHTEIKFDKPDFLVFINRSAEVNLKALDMANINMSGEDKLKIIYGKVYVAYPKQSMTNWINLEAWKQSVNDFQIENCDNYFVVKSVVIKRLTYTVYTSISGGFSATPTPVVAIDGKIFQESGFEQNNYEVFIQLVRLPYPSKNANLAETKIETAPDNAEITILQDSTFQMNRINENRKVQNNYQIKEFLKKQNIQVPYNFNLHHNIQN